MIAIYISVFIIGFLSGMWVILMMHRSAMKHSPNELIQAIRDYHEAVSGPEDVDDPDALIVSVENVNTHWYLYDISTNIFAGQGNSLEEAVAAVQARFPNRDVIVQQPAGN
jgi:hypothetical protein